MYVYNNLFQAIVLIYYFSQYNSIKLSGNCGN